MKKSLLQLLLLVLSVGLFSCDEDVPPPPRDFGYENRINEGKRFLTNFEGERARAVFKSVNSDYMEVNKGKPYCTATYGVVLADIQVVFKNMNSLILDTLLAGGAAAPATRAPYRPAANAQDFGTLMENAWSSFEPVLIEMSNYAAAVTSLENCTFSIGLGDPVNEKYEGPDNPYQFVLHIGANEDPLAKLIFKTRFDGAEARAIDMIARSILGGADLALAHDFSLIIDLYKIAYQLGLPLDCIKDNALNFQECMDAGTTFDADVILSRMLGWSFIFQDNPKFLAKSPLRWDERITLVDDEWAGAFWTMRSFFPSLVVRTDRLATQTAASKQTEQYLIIYKDENENSTVDSRDSLGINITKVELREDLKEFEDVVNAALPVLRESIKPSEGGVQEIQTFFDRMYGNMAAVDHPDVTHERIPINSFNTVVQDFFLAIIDTPTPNFMEFDLTSFFTNPKPIRDFIPHWVMRPTLVTLSEFIVDSDDYTGFYTGDEPASYPVGATDVAADDFLHYLDWDTYFDMLELERGVLLGSYDGGLRGNLSGMAVPSDCINGTNLYSDVKTRLPSGAIIDERINWPVLHLAQPDATLNGAIWVNLDAWSINYGPGNGMACVADPIGIQLGTNYSVTKAMWLWLDFIVDHFQFGDALALFQ